MSDVQGPRQDLIDRNNMAARMAEVHRQRQAGEVETVDVLTWIDRALKAEAELIESEQRFRDAFIRGSICGACQAAWGAWTYKRKPVDIAEWHYKTCPFGATTRIADGTMASLLAAPPTQAGEPVK